MIKKFLLIFNFTALCLTAQIDSLSNYFDAVFIYMEKSSLIDEDEETTIFESVEELLRNPININKAQVDDLLQIPFLDFSSANFIIAYRDSNKQYYSINELFLIDELSSELVNILKPLLTTSEQELVITEQKSFLKFIGSRNRLVNDIETREGYSKGNYLGNKLKLYNRIQASADKFFVNITQEKDAGEKSLTDFYSASFSISDYSFVNKIILGDYNLTFGQGLTLAKPFGSRKGSFATLSVLKNQKNLSEYTSSDENRFFRGAAGYFTYSNFGLTLFYSTNNISVNLNGENKITSLKEDGIFRTELDISKKHNTRLNNFGSSINYSLNKFKIGFLYQNLFYNNSFSEDYSIYIKDKNRFSFYSLDYSINFDDLFVSGEFSYNGLSTASINNLFINISRRFKLITSFRNYPSNYYNFFANGFGERSNTQNEIGFYTGFQVYTDFGIFDVYYDQFQFPNKNENKFQFSGNELSLFYQNKLSRNFSLNFRIFIEQKDDEFIETTIQIGKSKREKVRTDLIYFASKNLRLKTRFELNYFSLDEASINENGYLVYQDINFNPIPHLKFYGRIIVFKTDSFNTRIYEFENDLTGTFSSKPLFGDGFRWYLLIKYQIFNQLEIALKYSTTIRTDVESISSGNQEIRDNSESVLSFQVDLQF